MPSFLHPDRFLGTDPALVAIARPLYESVARLPLVCPHGHVDPALLALDERFPEPTALMIAPDHYVLRMVYSLGVPFERLGVPRLDGTPSPADPRDVWRTLAAHWHAFAATPTRAWWEYQLHEVLEIPERLSPATADAIYDAIETRLAEPAFRPRALFERFGIEVLTTTDGASDSLEHHEKIRTSGWKGRVVPCFRPDAACKIASPGWWTEIERLSRVSGRAIDSYRAFLQVLAERRRRFRELGATSTDHGVESPFTHRLSAQAAANLFEKALSGTADAVDQASFEAHMLVEMARMSLEDGLVMQLHAGSLRNHNPWLAATYGPDRGADIPVAVDWTRGLRPLLSECGNDARFRLVLFTLDEATYSRELAPIAGHYPAVRLGPPWWFHDSIEGMLRYRSLVTETAGFWNTAGFNDDTRAFLSIPARHDLARRIDARYVASLVADRRMAEDEAPRIMEALAVGLARDTYRLG